MECIPIHQILNIPMRMDIVYLPSSSSIVNGSAPQQLILWRTHHPDPATTISTTHHHPTPATTNRSTHTQIAFVPLPLL